MKAAYCELHRQGYAHSVEAWQDEILVGGLYGIAIGRAFFGESMFSRVSNASKVAFVTLVRKYPALKFSTHRLPGENRSSHSFRGPGNSAERIFWNRLGRRPIALR
jgi:hypothetical protein